MNKGIYIAVSGAVLKQAQMDVISQNLANSNTVGYKRDKVSFREYLLSQLHGKPEPYDGRTMSELSSVTTDYANGALMKTGDPLHAGIEGKGFFSIEGGKYTRRGDFVLDTDGYLLTKDGSKVLGSGGPVQIPEGTVEINDSGDISVNGELVDTLKLVEFEDDSALKKVGEGFYTADQEGGTSSGSRVKQGFLESSNVNVINEMVQMITALREFQAYEKAIHSFDGAIGKVINELGRI